MPRPEQLAYYGGLAVLAAFELIDWPVALVIAAGHILATNQHNRFWRSSARRWKRLKVACRACGAARSLDRIAALGCGGPPPPDRPGGPPLLTAVGAAFTSALATKTTAANRR